MADGRLNIIATMSAEQANREAEKFKRNLKDVASVTEDTSAAIDSMARKAGAALAGVFTARMAADFAKNVARTRGEFQQLEVAFSTMLRSEEKGVALMREMVDLAAKTPFDLQGVAQGAKQLLAYGSSAEEVRKELTMLGDIAAGLSMPLNDLVYLYGTTRTQGRMYTMDLRQFQGRGIPLADELAKKFGVAKDKVGELVTAGKVGFEDMRNALVSMTSEGGKFAGLMEKQSKTINGQISNIEDAFSQMMNEMGQKSEGIINKTLEGVSWLVENYEKVGKVIGEAVIAIGAYKTALIVLNAIHAISIELSRGYTLAQLAQYKALLAAEKAQKLLNATMLKNPYVLVGAAVAGLTIFLYKSCVAHNLAKKATEDHAKAVDTLNQKYQKEKNNVDSLISTINNEEASRISHNRALDELKRTYPSIFDKYIDEKGHISDLIALQKALNEERDRGRIKDESDLLGEYRTKLEDFERLRIAAEKGWDWSSAGTINNVAVLTKDKPWWQSNKSYLEEQISYWERMVIEQEKIVNKNTEEEFSARLKGMTDKQLAELKKEYDERVKKFGDLTKSERESLDKITAEIKSRKPKNHDKKYWEDLKKDAEMQLEALSDIEANGRKGLEIKKKIVSYQAKIDTFSINEKTESLNQSIINKERAFGEELADIDRKIALDKENIIDKSNDSIFQKNEREYNKSLEQIEDYKVKLLNKENEIAEAKYKAANHGITKGFVRSNTLSPESQKRIDAMTANASSSRAAADLNDLNALLKGYADYGYQRKNIEEKYDKDISALRQGLSDGTLKDTKRVNAAIVEAEKKKNKELYDLAREYSGDYAIIFADAASLPTNLLAEAIKRTDEEIKRAKDSGNIQALTDLYSQLNAQLKESSSRSWGFGSMSKGFSDIKEAMALFKSASDLSGKDKDVALSNAIAAQTRGLAAVKKGANDIANVFSSIGNSFSGLEGQIGELGKAISDIAPKFENFADGIASFKATGAKSGAITFALSTAVDLIGRAVGGLQRVKKEQEEWSRLVADTEHRYKILQIEAFKYEKSGVFDVESPYRKAVLGAKQYEKAMSELRSMSDRIGDAKIKVGQKIGGSWTSALKGAAEGALAGVAVGTIVPAIGNVVGGIVGGITGLIAGTIGGLKHVDVLKSLKEAYGEIYDPETFELNKQIQAQYEKLNDEGKRLVDNWEEIKKKAQEAKKALEDSLSEMVGHLSKDLSSLLVDAFSNGSLYSAIDKFHDKVSDAMSSIIEQRIFSIVFEDFFKGVEDEMKKSMGSGGDGSITDDLQRMDKGYRERLELYETMMNSAKKEMDALGYSVWKSSRQASVGGIQSVTQDSINDLSGRVTAIQGHTYSISENTKLLVSTAGNILKCVMSIDASTNYVAGRMHVIEGDLKAVKNTISDISIRGIALRK